MRVFVHILSVGTRIPRLSTWGKVDFYEVEQSSNRVFRFILSTYSILLVSRRKKDVERKNCSII